MLVINTSSLTADGRLPDCPTSARVENRTVPVAPRCVNNQRGKVECQRAARQGSARRRQEQAYTAKCALQNGTFQCVRNRSWWRWESWSPTCLPRQMCQASSPSLKVLTNQQKDGDSPVETVVTGLLEKRRKGTLRVRKLSLNCLFGGRNNNEFDLLSSSRELITELSMGSPERQRIERNTGEKETREKRIENSVFRVMEGQLTTYVRLSVHLYVTCFCFFVMLFCSHECRPHCCCSRHVALKPVLFATQPKFSKCVSSCSFSVPSPALLRSVK